MLKLEVGKFYKLRNGTKAQVLSTTRNDAVRPVVALAEIGTVFTLTEEGKYLGTAPWHEDIVEEWREPLVRYVNQFGGGNGIGFAHEYSARSYADNYGEGYFSRVAVKMVEVKE